jgi:hypothetical protein
MRIFAATLLCASICASPITAEVVTLEPVGDASIFSEFPQNASGADPVLYVGVTQFGDKRRAVLKFDLSGIPASAVIESATITFHVERSRGTLDQHSIHRVVTPWAEGPSLSPDPGAGGMGVAATGGDVTWSQASFPSTQWLTPGGDFLAPASSVAVFGDAGSSATFTGGGLAEDVALFVSDPELHHGWILIGAESGNFNARRLHAREAADPMLRPRLEVTYFMPSISDGWYLY